MQPRCKIWIETDTGLVMSDFRVDLLVAVEETGSLSGAAERLGLSYRRAWGKVRELENNLGVRLVESVAGGSRGGGSRLTADGAILVERYREFATNARGAIADAFDRAFGPPAPTDPAAIRSDHAGPR